MLEVLPLLLALGTPPEATLNANERIPIGFGLNRPRGGTDPRTIEERLQAAIEPVTSFTVDRMVEAQLANCSGKLPCIVQAYTKNSAGRSMARYLIVMSYLASPRQGRGDRVATLMMDLEAARTCEAQFGDDADTCLRQSAIVVRQSPTSVEDLDVFLGQLMKRHLLPVWRQSGHARPPGSLKLVDVPQDSMILLDGRIIGTTAGPTAMVSDVAAGQRQVSVQKDERILHTEVTTIHSQTVTTVAIPEPPPPSAAPRIAAITAGTALVVVGLGLSIATATLDTQQLCPTAPCSGRHYTVSEIFSRPETLAEDSSGGLPALPLGLGLATTGGTWLAGSLWAWEPTWHRWVWLTAGVLAGGLAYGITAIAR